MAAIELAASTPTRHGSATMPKPTSARLPSRFGLVPWRTDPTIAALLCLLFASALRAGDLPAETASRAVSAESLSKWSHFAEIQLPEKNASPWVDLVLSPGVFDKARYDLQDLRVYTQGGREVPFALRVLAEKSQQESVPAKPFNSTQTPDGASEVSLDLGRVDVEHNEVRLKLPGLNYRRRIELEGNNDPTSWRPIQQQDAIHFERGKAILRDDTIVYPPSRYRYLRVRVHRDPSVDKEPVKIEDATVLRTITVPGEKLSRTGELGPREPVPGDRGPGSAWVIGLGGDQVPVDGISVTVSDENFVRDFHLERGGPADSRQRFSRFTQGVWRRRAGEEPVPLTAAFDEVRAARLRLVVTDHRNDPLQVKQVVCSAAARQVILAVPQDRQPLRLYFGNPDALQPEYDFARNLPEKLDPKPARAMLGERAANPDYVPKPLPLTERWPWLIYVVLGSVIVVLGAIGVSLARAAIMVHDRDRRSSSAATVPPMG